MFKEVRRVTPNAGLMLERHRRRWANIESALGQRVVFTGMSLQIYVHEAN